MLRLVVTMLFESMSTLVWSFVILWMIIFFFAVHVVQGLTVYLSSQNANDIQLDLRTELLELYGGVGKAVMCLFMMVSGGIDWREGIAPIKEVNPWYGYFLCFYVFFMVMFVLNVVFGAFVARSVDVFEKDRELIIQSEMAHVRSYLEKVRAFFVEADTDGSGTLSFEEFKQYLEDQHVSAYFQALGLDVSQAELCFNLLDSDNSGMLNLEEFLGGCLRLKGPAKSLDVNLLLHESRRMSKMFRELRHAIHSNHGNSVTVCATSSDRLLS